MINELIKELKSHIENFTDHLTSSLRYLIIKLIQPQSFIINLIQI